MGRRRKLDRPDKWNLRACHPKTFRSIIQWFHRGWIRIGDPKKPYGEFMPFDPFDHAVVINGCLKRQLPEYQPDPPQYEFQILEEIEDY